MVSIELFIIAGVLISYALAGYLAICAGLKWRDPTGSYRFQRRLGIGARAARRTTVWVPLLEFSIAVLLVLPGIYPWGALSSAGLFAAYALGVWWGLARRPNLECHCFGRLSSGSLSVGDVLRNLALSSGAMCLTIDQLALDHGSLPNAGAWSIGATMLIGGGILAGLIPILVSRLPREIRGLLRPTAEPPGAVVGVGENIPCVWLRNARGEDASLCLAETHRRTLLLFFDQECQRCEKIGTLLKVLCEPRPAGTDLVLVHPFRRDLDPATLVAARHLERLYLQPGRMFSAYFGVIGDPGAALISASGKLMAPPARGVDAVLALLRREGLDTPFDGREVWA